MLLVVHSGAGMLLPAIRQALGRPIAGYIFVDAGIPYDGKSRLDLFDREGAEQFRSSAVDGLLPTWTDADLADVIPDTRIRSRFIAELRPLPIAVYEEPLPVFDRWPDAPCGYVAFLPEEGQYVYRDALSHAEQHSWPCAKIKGMHFHMLVDPAGVADALVEVAGRMGVFQTRGAGV
ncbi:MAG TPA: alpha/beta hydrolase [Chloroflexia bacterium]|nr:alpha/beta hydrolase [Chloroflexia bacterium]